MMRPKTKIFTLVAQAANNIALSQTPGAAGNLTLAGALAAAGVIPQQTMGYLIGITSAADETARSFVVTGLNANGNAQSETVAGVNAAVAKTTKYYSAITSIAVDAATAGAITVGTLNTVNSAVTPTYPLDVYEFATSFVGIPSGTINFDMQVCYERVNDAPAPTPNWFSDQATKTALTRTSFQTPIGAIRLLVNSYTNGATIGFTIAQSESS